MFSVIINCRDIYMSTQVRWFVPATLLAKGIEKLEFAL